MEEEEHQDKKEESKDSSTPHRYFPPVVGKLKCLKEVRDRVAGNMQAFTQLNHPWVILSSITRKFIVRIIVFIFICHVTLQVNLGILLWILQLFNSALQTFFATSSKWKVMWGKEK